MIVGRLETTCRTKCIRDAIHSEEMHLRSLHPWLAQQDLLGLVFFAGSLMAMICVVALYLNGVLAWWIAVPLMALPISILHELEHDLIHDLYFKRRAWVQHLMFFVIWFCKLSINPWYRREIHLKHHQVSGQETDIEERLIGLGLPLGFVRLLVAIHPLAGLVLFRRIERDVPDFRAFRLALLSTPTYLTFLVIWEAFMGYIRIQQGWTIPYDPCLYLPAWGWPWVKSLTVLIVLPNVLRQTCLVIMSTYTHYYGDIPKHDVFFQNQIVSNWAALPFQLFCFNFGATHIIHHFVINQPFYLRQMVADSALAEMRRQGIRSNDAATFLRANRWNDEPSINPSEPLAEHASRWNFDLLQIAVTPILCFSSVVFAYHAVSPFFLKFAQRVFYI